MVHMTPAISNRPPIRECGNILIDVQKDGRLRYGPPPECPETEEYYCLMRQEVYERLLRVQQALPRGCHLRLYESLRSLAVQALLFEQERSRVIARHPCASPLELHVKTTVLVSPVTNLDGSPNVPPHCTGGAVDVEIVDDTGRVIDFGMEIRDWPSVDPKLCHPGFPDISPCAASNRKLLAAAMTEQGFATYEHEWWHFSYGDQNWAESTGRSHAIYGPCSEAMILAAKFATKRRAADA